MPALTQQRVLRQRQFALGKSAFLEAEFLMEAEPLAAPSKQPLHAGDQSPVSIASDIFMPEMKPIVLPGAWTVVGKGGRPIKNIKMYDEPKKKQKRVRARKSKNDEDATLFATLEEVPSSSQCLSTLYRTKCLQEKAAVSSKQLKIWKRSKEVKSKRAMARDTLLVDMLEVGLLEPDDACPVPTPVADRHCHMGSSAEKKRRSIRQARQASKCYGIDQENLEDDLLSPGVMHTAKRTATLSTPSNAADARPEKLLANNQDGFQAADMQKGKASGRMKRLRAASGSASAVASPKGKNCLVM